MTVSLNIIDQTAPPVAPNEAITPNALFDSHGRQIRHLRLSVTDRCNFRCIYCMEPDFKYMPKTQLLTLNEYIRLIEVGISLGVTKVRITGGEPTLYPQLDELLFALGELGLKDLAMTTNGSQLTPAIARRWKTIGLNRITVSLDTLRSDRKDAITRAHTPLDTVIRAIDIARDAGLTPVKVNAVMMRGVNDDEVSDFAEFARVHGIDMRLIEFMALDGGRRWSMDKVVSATEMLKNIRRTHDIIREEDPPSSTSINFRFKEGEGRIGIIASVTRSFCGACDRLRIMADGTVRPCLFSDDEWCLRSLLRDGASDDDLRTFITNAVWAKSAGHGMGRSDFVQPEKTMSTIGG
jgi:cyclic pyranopterin phosphate synthase